jgi:cell division control protein 6
VSTGVQYGRGRGVVESISGIRILNSNALTHSYIPSKLPHREEEYDELIKEYKLISYGFPPSHMMIFGPPGSGKTVTIRKALKDSGIPHVYLTSEPTAYGTLVALGEIVLGRRLWGLSFAPLWNEIEIKLPRNCVLVLDEAERFMISDKKSDLLLYYLSRREGLGLILVSNKTDLADYIKDARVKSSLKPTIKFFKPYNADELKEIIRLRAQEALGNEFEKFFKPGIIGLIAALASKRGGDARYSIDLLREALKKAIISGSETINEEHINEAKIAIEETEFETSIKSLSKTHKLMLLCALTLKRVGAAYKEYNMIAENFGLLPLSERRLRDILGDLELMGFIGIEKKGREWLINPSKWFDTTKAKEILQRELDNSSHS